MNENQRNHPLHGINLETLLGELVRHYGWEVLAEQIPVKCFQSYPTFASCIKFFTKTRWARERLEAFYMYRYKALPRPSDEQFALPPRERRIMSSEVGSPIELVLGDKEFFDDPASGVPHTKLTRHVANTKVATVKVSNAKTSDPWAKWRS